MMTSNHNYGGNYLHINNRTQNPQQTFATSSATTAEPYYGTQSFATPARTYPSNDYQYQQYQQPTSANSGGGYNWGVYSPSKATPPASTESVDNHNVPEQRPNATTKPSTQSSYDTSSLGGLAYASALNYGPVAEMGPNTASYSGPRMYTGDLKGGAAHLNPSSQVHNRIMPGGAGSAAPRAAAVLSRGRANELAAGPSNIAAYNLPTPSPAYPPSLINTYPQSSSNTPTSNATVPAAVEAPDTMGKTSRNVQHNAYTPNNYPQPQKPPRSFEQGRKSKTPTPRSPPIAGNTTTAGSNAYANQSRAQPARGPHSQSARASQTRPQPAGNSNLANTPKNVVHRIGDGQIPAKQNLNSQSNRYEPVSTPHISSKSNLLPLPVQVPTTYHQKPPPPPPPPRRPSPDRPTTVDPSHVYNSYHEYQKQIEAAEAEAAAKSRAMEAENEPLHQQHLRAQQQSTTADMGGAALEAAMTLVHTMSANNVVESESESKDDGEDTEDNGNEQQTVIESTPGNTTHMVSPVNTSNLTGKAASKSQELLKDDSSISMEEEMRRMVEKLREYQSKDPKLFLQVWSSVKKAGSGQSPQSQAEGSQAQGGAVMHPTEQPLRKTTPSISQVVAAPQVPAGTSSPQSSSAQPSASNGGKSVSQRVKTPQSRADMNAKRRARRAMLKAAQAERAGTSAAEASAPAVIPASLEPASVVSGKLVVENSPGNSKSVKDISSTSFTAQPPRKTADQITTSCDVTDTTANTKPEAQNISTPSLQAGDRSQHPNPTTKLPPQQRGGTWPTDKRDAIARTAATVLNEIPDNAGEKIEPSQIRAMLEGNPSYIELCEMIERMGFKMDRARFAKTLLAVLPNSSSRPQAPRAVAQPVSSGLPAHETTGATMASSTLISEATAHHMGAQNAAQQIISTPVPAPVSSEVTGAAPIPVTASSTPGSLFLTAQTPRRGRGRPRKDGLPVGSGPSRVPKSAKFLPHMQSPAPANINPKSSVQNQIQSAPSPSTTAPVSAVADLPRPARSDPTPHQPPTTQGAGSSVTISSEEKHKMSLLQAYVGRTTEARSPTAMPKMRDASTYTSPYPSINPSVTSSTASATVNQNTRIYRNKTAPQQISWNSRSPSTSQGDPHPTHPHHMPQNNISNPIYRETGPSSLLYYNSPFRTYNDPRSSQQHQPPQPPISPQSNQPLSSRMSVSEQSQTKTQLPAMQTSRVVAAPVAPLSKEATARKRTFAEIIDLTNTESSDKEGEPHRKMRQTGDRLNNFSALAGPQSMDVNTRTTLPNSQLLQSHPRLHHTHNHSHNIENLPTESHLKTTRNPLLEYDGIVKSIDRSLALRKSRYNPKTIARDILLSTGRHPTQRSLNGHLERLKERFARVDNTSDLSTFRWDIVDPGGAMVGSANMESTPELTFPPDSMLGTSSLLPNRGVTQPTRGGSHGFGPGLSRTTYDPIPSRPSKLRNETSNFAIVIPDDGPPIKAPKRRGRPPRDPNAVPKKTPVGRHSGIEEEEEPITRSANSERGSRTKRLSRSRRDVPQTTSRLSLPRYEPFLCEWKGCKAELQNLETLRRHLYSVHGKASVAAGISCLWGKCGREEKDFNDSVEVLPFTGVEDFKKHIETAHLVPLSWHLGDGPRGSTIDGNESDQTSYLRSATGKLVTPSVADQVVESGSAVANNLRRERQAAATAATGISQWSYWCGPNFVVRPALREGEFESEYAKTQWEDPYEVVVKEGYSEKLQRAAEVKGSVYCRDMPEDAKKILKRDKMVVD